MSEITRDFLHDGRDDESLATMDLSDMEKAMIDVVRTIYDPEIPVPIWDLGLIYGWTLTEGDSGTDAAVSMTLTAPNCPAAESLPREVEEGINALDGVGRASVEITFVPSYSMEMLSDEARLTLGFM